MDKQDVCLDLSVGKPSKSTLQSWRTGAGPGWLMGSANTPVSQPRLGNARAAPSGDSNAGPSFAMAVLAGGFASATVDVSIYPLDTLKTRLQAPQGFQRAGGTTGLFRGVMAAAVGAVPGGAVFFGAYEYTRQMAQGGDSNPHWTTDAVAATVAATAVATVVDRWAARV